MFRPESEFLEPSVIYGLPRNILPKVSLNGSCTRGVIVSCRSSCRNCRSGNLLSTSKPNVEHHFHHRTYSQLSKPTGTHSGHMVVQQDLTRSRSERNERRDPNVIRHECHSDSLHSGDHHNLWRKRHFCAIVLQPLRRRNVSSTSSLLAHDGREDDTVCDNADSLRKQSKSRISDCEHIPNINDWGRFHVNTEATALRVGETGQAMVPLHS
jgi:hypothetical protein